ncbi:MAG: GNAT family N-acetyltransferase [Bacteroidetes bacterium]|nr:GNAT family N-acetyltransferase [Bacteroidota bacterium]
MAVTIREAVSPADLKAFARLPWQIYKGNRYWVPPMFKDEVKALQAATNPAFGFCEAKFWLAEKNGRTAGRIGAIINHEDIKKTGQKMARFTRTEFIDDPEVVDALFATAEAYAREKGMEGIHGPLGFTNLDHQAMLVEGFDHLPSVASEYHLPYYGGHLDRLGYEKEIDWVEFRLTIQEIPEKALRLNEAIKQRYGLKVISFTSREQMKPYPPKIFRLLNEAFAELFSMVALNEEMMKFYTEKYFGFLNPEFVKVIETAEGEVVGFIVGLPSLSEAMQKANGSLLPFGWWHLMKAMKNPTVVDLMLTGVHPQYQGQGVPALLITELQQVMIAKGVKYAETTGILESNQKAIQVWKNYEHIQHKRKRCYLKKW